MTTPETGPTAAQVARMRAKIADGIRSRERRKLLHRRVAAGVSVVVVASLVTGGAILATLPELSRQSFVCYAGDALDADREEIGYPIDLVPPTDVSEQVTWALDLCVIARDMRGFPPPADPVVCRLDDLRFGVFPNESGLPDGELCEQLALRLPLDPIPGYVDPVDD